MPDNDNPYAAPQSHEELGFDCHLPQIWVDGDFLVVASGVSLPPRCVFTNESISEPLIRQNLKWAPSFRLVLTDERVRVSCAVNAGHQKKSRKRLLLVGVGQLLVAVLSYASNENLIVSLIFAGSAVVAFREKPTYLRIAKRQNNRFWLKGCGPAFLASCLDEFGDQIPTEA